MTASVWQVSSFILKHIFDCQTDVLCNLPEKDWRKVSTHMKRYGRAPSIFMPILLPVSHAGVLLQNQAS